MPDRSRIGDAERKAICAFVVRKRARPTGDAATKISPRARPSTQDNSTPENSAIVEQLAQTH